jgi:hypothetical protein
MPFGRKTMRILRWRLMETSPDDGGGGGGSPDGGGDAPDRAAIETEARGMGWAPKDRWRGDPNAWLDADKFVERGKTFVPFLQHERKKLRGELDQRDQVLNETKAELAAVKEQLKGITTFNEQMAKDRQARRKAEIGVELKAAREAGDDVRVAELQNELGDVIKPPVVTPPPTQQQPPQNQPPAGPQVLPWVKGFLDSNEDFFANPRKVALFNVEVLERRKGGDTRVGEGDGVAFLTEAREAVERMMGGNPRRQMPSKGEESRPGGGNNSGGGGGAGGKTFADLPADARSKCDSQEERYVGKDKVFKDQKSWRAHYVSEYFGPSATAMSRQME